MTEAKRPWTPGPWLMRKADGYDNVFEIGLSKFGHERLGLSGVRDNSYMYIHGSMIEADARLISAAPDMAEALLSIIDAHRRGDVHGGHEAIGFALDALRKAGMEGV